MKINLLFIKLIILPITVSFITVSVVVAQNEIPEREQSWAITTAMMSVVAYPLGDHHDFEPKLRDDGWAWVTSSEDPSGLQYTEFQRINNGKREVVIAFAGTKSAKDFIGTDIAQALIPPEQYRDALQIAALFVKEKDASKDMTLIFTGHSLGGGLAQIVSFVTGIKSYVFNSAGLFNSTMDFPNSPGKVFLANVFLKPLVDIGLSSPLADWYLNRPERTQMASSVIMNFRDARDLVSHLGEQLGTQYILNSENDISIVNQWGKNGIHFMENIIEEIKNNSVDAVITNGVRHPNNPVIGLANTVNDLKSFNPMNTLFVGSNSALEKINNFKLDNLSRFFMVSSGNIDKDKQVAASNNFKTIIYTDQINGLGLDKEHIVPNTLTPRLKPLYLTIFPYLSGGGRGGGGGIGSNSDPLPPPPPPIPINASKIGGVMLSGVADVENASSSSAGNKTFSFIFNANQPVLDIDEYKKFCTSLWAVYFDQSCPGISIDPISFDKSVKVQMVRYIGSVINTDLGRVMREADYNMKKWAVGTEKPDIPGFRDVDQLMSTSHINYFGASRRFWFVPQDMHFTAGSNFLLFTGGKMTLKTEYIFLDNKSEKAEPADIAFADFFTNHYNEIADKYPIYKELFDYAKYVSLANYLKQNKIPLLWFLLANKKLVVTENSPGTVKQLAKGSKYFKGTTIVGGVDLKYPKGQYVYDNTAVTAIKQAMTNQTGQSNLGISNENIQKTNAPISFKYKNDSLTFLKEYALTSGTDFAGNTYQTDLSLWYGNEPGLEIVRKSNDRNDSPGEFGGGWQYLIPYKMDVLRKDSVISGNYVFRKYCVIKNEITNSTDTMVFNKKKYDCIGYVPVDSLSNEFILLLPLTDGTFELSDKLGNLYTFNKNGSMTKMVLGNQREEHYIYNTKNMNPQKYHDLPLTIEIGNTTIDTGNYRMHDKIKVLDHINNTSQMFSVHLSDGYIRYKPENIDSTIYEEIKPLTDNKFLLTDKSGGKYYFDNTGLISETFSGYEYKVEYDYFKNGIDNFQDSPYKIAPASDDRINVGALTIPKSLKLWDNINKKEVLFNYSDTSKQIKYYTNDSNSIFSGVVFLTNGYLKAIDKNGNIIFFNTGGEFESIIPYGNKLDFIKSVKQGDYEAEFIYTMLPENIPVVSKIIIYKSLERKLIYTIEYSYDDYGNVVKRVVL